MHDPLTHLQVISQLLKAALQIFTTLHQVLDIVYAREVCPEQLKKVGFLCGEWTARQDL